MLSNNATFDWLVGDTVLCRQARPMLMGILNVTPDSFSDGGQHNTIDAAVSHGLQLVDDGADILDVGGESTRPGAEPVSVQDELRRTIPVIEQLAKETSIPISIDTTKSEVAAAAIDAGALIINDISGMTFDPQMISIAADLDVAVCVMHILGTPQTMQQEPVYKDVINEVSLFLQQRLDACEAAGIARQRVCLDPGIGFGKTADHNLQLLRGIDAMKIRLERPLLIGHSRKRFLSSVLGRNVEERLAGTIGVSIGIAQNGGDIIRVHDVKATLDALIAWDTVCAESQR